MRARIGLTVLTLVSVVAGVIATPATAAPGDDFRSPSGAISCAAVYGDFVCRTKGSPHRVAPGLACNFFEGTGERAFANEFGWFDDRPQACSTLIQDRPETSRNVLGYGRSITYPMSRGTVTCTMRFTGVTCVRSIGTRMFVSRTAFTR